MDKIRELPRGLGMALAQDSRALMAYAGLSEARKLSVISRARAVDSKEDMQRIIDGLTKGSF
ncbi:MAG: hypothetical protein SOU50_00200 [Oscillospiraceae bacterium]|nr:hypothetical protein [Oscillospiraceae bacterium]MDD7429979.1 hypothetical protein [Oscillospiraceae bacterium]MDY2846625.1 hypothetical protein [Oscillospiraceae bacterium]